eukprot:2275116-Rhodomonas_salina.4
MLSPHPRRGLSESSTRHRSYQPSTELVALSLAAVTPVLARALICSISCSTHEVLANTCRAAARARAQTHLQLASG